MNELADARHLDRAGLSEYLAAGAHAALKIVGSPVLYLVVDPPGHTLRLRAPHAQNKLPDVGAYRNLSAEIIHWNDAQWCQLSISGPIILDAYPVLLSIADRIQKSGAEFAAATRASLDAFREILAAGRGLSEEAETGLFGEVLILRHFLKTLPEQSAIDAWRGHGSEEHDFGLSDFDLEVKTTTSESRRHWINSLTQLRPTLARPLFLVSLQVTGAGVDGLRLADLIEQTEAITPEPLRGALRAKLSEAGWQEAISPTHARRFRLRTNPAVYAVAGDFPVLTPETLKTASNAIVQVRYMIDLSHVAPASPLPGALANFDGGID